MRNKFYENTSLRQYFNNYVSQMSVAKVYKPLLVDILMRRAHEFELSPKDISQDMQSLLDNLEHIEIKTLPKRFNSIGGVYNSITKTITLNARCLDQMRNNMHDPKLYEILTHEVYHALSRDRHGKDRLASVNAYSGKGNYSLLEVIVEKAADRCVYPRNGNSAPYFNQNTYGYTDITFITDALAATYGVSEKDFLKNAIMGRKRLVSFLAYRGNESPEETSKFLDSVELNFSKLHAELYPEGIIGRKNTPEEREREVDTIKRCMMNIYGWCEYKFADRIENTPLGGLREAERFENELKYHHNKLTFVMENALYRFSNRYRRPDIYNDVSRDVEPSRMITTDRINDIDVIIKNYSKMSLPDAIALINESRHGKLEHYPQYLSRLGITLNRSKLFSESSRTVSEYMYSDFDGSIWENDAISEYMARTLPKHVKRGNTFLNLVGTILPIGKRNKDMLLMESEIKTESTKGAFGALPKEEQDRINTSALEQATRKERTREKTTIRQLEEK